MNSGQNVLVGIFRNLFTSGESLPLQLTMPPPDKSQNVYLHEFGVRVTYKTYTGHASRSREITTLRANSKIPSSIPVYYFEVMIDNLGSGGTLALGVAPCSHSYSKVVGSDNGYGFAMDEGKKYSYDIKGTLYGSQCCTDDIVGCCVDFVSRSVFFTINGDDLGQAYSLKNNEELIPMVSLQSHAGSLSLNFGDNPFSFDIESYVKEKIDYLHGVILNQTSIKEDPFLDMEVLRTAFDYLTYNNFAETVIKCSDLTDLPLSRGIDELRKRKEMFDFIRNGDLQKGFEVMNSQYSFIKDDFPRTYLLFNCLIFIQYITLNSANIHDDDSEGLNNILKKAKAIYNLYKMQNPSKDTNELNIPPDECGLTCSQWNVYLREIFCLIAYKDVSEFFKTRDGFDLTKNLIHGLSYALKSGRIETTLDYYLNDAYGIFTALSTKNDIMSTLALALMDSKAKHL